MHDFSVALYSTWKGHFDRAFKGESFTIIWTEEKEDRTIYEEIRFNPIFDGEGNTTGASCFSRDVTERQIHLQMIERQNVQLREIAWIQSHEVRSPLATILGLVELINTEKPQDALNLELLTSVKEAAYKLDLVIKKITARTRA